MVNRIYELKNRFIEKIESDISQRGIERINIEEMGKMVDMVKDLAEAEAYCMKAKYYDTVTTAMEESDKGSSGYTNPMREMGGKYSSRDAGSSGYQYGSMGHTDIMEPLRQAMQNAGPDERSKLRNEVLSMVGTR